ncbi:UNVERIFIED_ORG: hypothetical protein J2Y78_000317 [Buttiauxella agrestis ATCC 33320]
MKPIFLCCATDAPASVLDIKAVSKKVPATGINYINYGLLRSDILPAVTFALKA